jgi:hypothetical protein
MDTMSMHISCSGFSHEQRDTILGADKNDPLQVLLAKPSNPNDKMETRLVFFKD